MTDITIQPIVLRATADGEGFTRDLIFGVGHTPAVAAAALLAEAQKQGEAIELARLAESDWRRGPSRPARACHRQRCTGNTKLTRKPYCQAAKPGRKLRLWRYAVDLLTMARHVRIQSELRGYDAGVMADLALPPAEDDELPSPTQDPPHGAGRPRVRLGPRSVRRGNQPCRGRPL
jgi:hypothetical protein